MTRPLFLELSLAEGGTITVAVAAIVALRLVTRPRVAPVTHIQLATSDIEVTEGIGTILDMIDIERKKT